LMRNSSNLNGLLEFCFGVEIDPNNINELTLGFKSPCDHSHDVVAA
jgi:hypothetical protein